MCFFKTHILSICLAWLTFNLSRTFALFTVPGYHAYPCKLRPPWGAASSLYDPPSDLIWARVYPCPSLSYLVWLNFLITSLISFQSTFLDFLLFFLTSSPLTLYFTKSIVHGTLPILSPPGIEWHKAIYTSFSQSVTLGGLTVSYFTASNKSCFCL